MYKKLFLAIIMCVLLASCKGTKYTANGVNKPSKTTTQKKGSISIKTKSKKENTKSKTAHEHKNNKKKSGHQENLVATSNTTVYADVIYAYIDQYREIAKDNMRNYGIPASITLAQGILESGSGKGKLAREANNHFGIKCHKEWIGDFIRHDDDEAQECFRKYRHASESFRDHSLFLTSRSRYEDLFKLDKDDYEGWAKGLRKAGYATDPKYPNKLIGLIERYELYNYDNEVLGKPVVSKPKPVAQTAQPKPEPTKEQYSNRLTHKVTQGDTLYSISTKYKVSIDQIKQLNDLNGNNITIGQILILK
ncbi:MAG: glucosaminidase domain-containing protein [Bacteroidota bacterium]|nr:glucosaminidase domain-containing protein [Bacteroidota bacterium]